MESPVRSARAVRDSSRPLRRARNCWPSQISADLVDPVVPAPGSDVTVFLPAARDFSGMPRVPVCAAEADRRLRVRSLGSRPIERLLHLSLVAQGNGTDN